MMMVKKVGRLAVIFGLMVLSASAVVAKPAALDDLYLPHMPNASFYTVISDNWLPNPSFEGSWYHPNNVPELQIPQSWRFSYEEGENPLDPDPWNVWVRPEVRVLPREFLPPHEHPLFIWDGNQTVKVFKGYGAINFELETDVTLLPGDYLFEVFFYPDLVVDYEDGQKVFAPDPLSGEFRFIVDGVKTEWWLPEFGARNRMQHFFTVDEAGIVTVGVGMRGRWAIANNGWFMDDWRLVRVVQRR
jgi:hypothetical protein